MTKKSMLGFIVLVLCMSFASVAFSNLVPQVCKNLTRADPANVNFEFCISALGSDPRSNTSMAPQLGEISFELTISKAKAITITIDKLLKLSAPRSPVEQAALKNCLGVYSRVLGDLNAGLTALKGGDFNKANARVSSAMNDAATCKIKMTKKGNKGFPLMQKIIDFHNLSAISLGFTKLLKIIN